jgi:hypothetical protein
MVRVLGLLCTLVILVASSRADADVLVLYGDVHGGGMFGTGMSGDAEVKDQAFFANVPNVGYGLSVSGRFLFLGATIQHHQYNDGSDLATWTQAIAGLDFTVDLGSDKEKKEKKGSFLQIGAGAGFGVGTGQQVDTPLSNDEIDDKGFLLEGKFGFGKHLSKFFDFGLLIPVTYGYFFKNGVPANMLDNHYQGLHAEALLYLRLRLKLL